MSSRALSMLTLYKHGHTLQSIGDKYGLTRERVRQILHKHFGIRRNDGGARVQRDRRLAATESQRDRRYFDRHGMSYGEFKALPPKAKYSYWFHKRNARYRCIPFNLSLRAWWRIWLESGKWEQSGRGADRYCMARVDDSGGYEVGNVQIITNAENCRLYALSKKGKPVRPKDKQGVCLLYPGLAKPYVAYHNKKRLGHFATEEEAYQARRAALAEAA